MFEDDELDEPLINANNSSDDELDEPLINDSFDDSELDMPLDNTNNSPEETGDPNFQGIIRTVKGAVLVYKRKTPDDTFEELWVFNIGKDMKQESIIRRAILAGTDIDPMTGTSTDGTQIANSYSVGNVQFLQLDNIDN